MLGHLSARRLLGRHAYSTLSVGDAGPAVRTSICPYIDHSIHIAWESFHLANPARSNPNSLGLGSQGIILLRDQL